MQEPFRPGQNFDGFILSAMQHMAGMAPAPLFVVILLSLMIIGHALTGLSMTCHVSFVVRARGWPNGRLFVCSGQYLVKLTDQHVKIIEHTFGPDEILTICRTGSLIKVVADPGKLMAYSTRFLGS